MIIAHRLLPLTAAALFLSACNQSTQQAAAPQAPAQPSFVTPTTFRMPEGAGCTGSVNRFRAIMNNDLETGHVNKKVYDVIIKDIDAAAQMCASGNDAGSRAAISASRARHGYPAG